MTACLPSFIMFRMKHYLALVQPPMYLLMEEDTQCAERTPPWGAPDIGTYIGPLRGNLATLRDTPGLKLGYEWSALELERLSEWAPDCQYERLGL